MNKTAQKHLAAIQSGTINRTNVIGLRKLINASERTAAGWSIGVTASAVDMDSLDDIESAIAEHLPRVTGELVETGIAQLQNKRYAKQLARVAEHLQHVAQFRLAGFDRIGRNSVHSVPVYRAYDGSGGYLFTFRNIPWQSGGNGPELIGA
jgi:hypothetical protein